MQIIKENICREDMDLFSVKANDRICIKYCVTLLFKIHYGILFQKTPNAILQHFSEFASFIPYSSGNTKLLRRIYMCLKIKHQVSNFS